MSNKYHPYGGGKPGGRGGGGGGGGGGHWSSSDNPRRNDGPDRDHGPPIHPQSHRDLDRVRERDQERVRERDQERVRERDQERVRDRDLDRRGPSRDYDYPTPPPPPRQAPPLNPYDGPPQQQQQPVAVLFPNQASGEPLPNDCEILSLNNPDEAYVNMVENAVKDIPLKVDVMIPKSSVKITSFIENLALKGTTFAIVVRPDNAIHGSVSVHVLRGSPKPEEHRNMPLATACALMQKWYLELKRKEIGVLPENITTILRYLLDDRSVTDTEYAVLIGFLQERRKRQASFESRTHHDSEKKYYTPEELQQKILALIGGSPKAPPKFSGSQQPEVVSRPLDHNPINPLAKSGSSGYGSLSQGPPQNLIRPFHM